jgi:uncharacterized protein
MHQHSPRPSPPARMQPPAPHTPEHRLRLLWQGLLSLPRHAQAPRWAGAAGLCALLLAGCASEAVTRFHSLLPVPVMDAQGAAATVLGVQSGAQSGAQADRQTLAMPRAAPARGWELLPVTLPVQVDRPQWVLRRQDQTLQVLEHERWVAPLADEVHAALVQQLLQSPAGGTPAQPPVRITLELLRWDAMLGAYSRIDAQWTLNASTGAPRNCRTTVQQAAGAGLDGMAAAHRAAIAQLGRSLAASLAAPLGC